jgi:hypothetical protein
MQVNQCRDRHARHAKRHSGAGGGIEHPRRHDDHHAGRYLDMDDLAAVTPFRGLPSNPSPMQSMPAVANFNFLPDMGRMTP